MSRILVDANSFGAQTMRNEEKKFIQDILKQILNSRRLLIDHVECLDNILLDVENEVPKCDFFSTRNTLIFGSLIAMLEVTGKIWKPIRPGAMLIGGGFGMLYLYKLLKHMRDMRAQHRVDLLIQSLRGFGNCVKKNISYFNESLFIQGRKYTSIDVQNKRAWGCIQSIKKITEILFHATRHLEHRYPLLSKLKDIYSPIEDLYTCHYFSQSLTEFNFQHIKDFYNIFAYIQSQFLIRLALSVTESAHISYMDDELSNLSIEIEKVLDEEEYSFMKIASSLKKRKTEELSKPRRSFTDKNHYAPIIVLKDISLKLTAGIVAVAEECEKLDNALQNVDEMNSNQLKKLVDIANKFGTLEHCLSTCNDDFQRLVLIYNKYILKQTTLEQERNECDVLDEYDHLAMNQRSEGISNDEIDIPTGDDYFAYLYDELVKDDDEEQDFGKSIDYELYNLDHKITKRRFKPVLKQLMDKIDPIREDALKTERTVLEAKGIDVNKFYGCVVSENGTQLNEDIDYSDDEEVTERRKYTKRTDQYSDVREFLAEKPPTNLFFLSQPPRGMCEEDIIE